MSKTFDCVEMKRKGQETVGSRTAEMTREQVLEYWKRKTDDLRKRAGQVPKPTKKLA